MRTLQDVERELAARREELETVTGRETEIYSRIVGYYRSLKNWNHGKREEFRHRTTYEVERSMENAPDTRPAAEPLHLVEVAAVAPSTPEGTIDGAIGYRYFYRTTCPNCKAMKSALDEHLGDRLERQAFNVDEESGFEQARQDVILSTPTVVFFDGKGNEVKRTSDPIELVEVLGAAAAS